MPKTNRVLGKHPVTLNGEEVSTIASLESQVAALTKERDEARVEASRWHADWVEDSKEIAALRTENERLRDLLNPPIGGGQQLMIYETKRGNKCKP